MSVRKLKKNSAEAVALETIANILAYFQSLERKLFFIPKSDPLAAFHSSPLTERIYLIFAVANGEIDRATADSLTVGTVGEATQSICETLFVAPNGRYVIPDDFWNSQLGQAIMQCKLWINNDTLITQSEAAQLLYGRADKSELNKIRRLIRDGKLYRYVSLDEPNPRRAGRVSVSDVQNIKSRQTRK